MVEIVFGVLEQSLIFGILALGSYISYKILDFPDLSVEGTFPMGAAVTALLITNDLNPYLVLMICFFAGAVAGVVTGIIHVKLKITDLLSGIIVLTGIYSINLMIAGSGNLPIFSKTTMFGSREGGFANKLIIALILFLIVKILLDLFLKTKLGFLLRSSGDNVQFVTSLGKDVGLVKILGLSVANGLAALSGSVWCQYQRNFDIGMGKNMIVVGLSSVIIGMNVFKKITRMKDTTKALMGCVIYNLSIAAAVNLGLDSKYMNLIIALLFLLALLLNGDQIKIRRKSDVTNRKHIQNI